MKTRILAFVCVLCLLLSLAACGGILGYTTPEAVTTDLLPMIADLRIEDCANTGTLTGDTDGAPLITDDLCASWNNRLK